MVETILRSDFDPIAQYGPYVLESNKEPSKNSEYDDLVKSFKKFPEKPTDPNNLHNEVTHRIQRRQKAEDLFKDNSSIKQRIKDADKLENYYMPEQELGFIRGLKDVSPKVRAEVAMRLRDFRGSSEPNKRLYNMALSDPDLNVRLDTIREIGHMAGSSAEKKERFLKYLRDKDSSIAENAAKGLVLYCEEYKWSNDDLFELVKEIINHSNPKIRNKYDKIFTILKAESAVDWAQGKEPQNKFLGMMFSKFIKNPSVVEGKDFKIELTRHLEFLLNPPDVNKMMKPGYDSAVAVKDLYEYLTGEAKKIAKKYLRSKGLVNIVENKSTQVIETFNKVNGSIKNNLNLTREPCK